MGGGRTVEKYNHGLKDCGGVHATNYTNGCRCDACKEWSFMKSKSYSLRKLRGEVDCFVDAGPTREILLRLRSLGYTRKELNRFGVYHVDEIIHGKCKVKRSTEQKVREISGRRLYDTERVDSRAAMHLVRRWMDSGLIVAEISKASGVSRQTIRELTNGTRTKVQARTLGRLLRAKPAIDEMAMCKRGEL